jgi:serine/threonine protein kinase
MERRHKNINNEIMMEKRVLNKLSHPNIVTMYGTFQDESSLYYHMEFLGGGELWGLTREKDEKSGLFSMVGVHWSLLSFYMAGTVILCTFMLSCYIYVYLAE